MKKRLIAAAVFIFLASCSQAYEKTDYSCSYKDICESMNNLCEYNATRITKLEMTINAPQIIYPTETEIYRAGYYTVIEDYYNYLINADCYKAYDLLSYNYKEKFWRDNIMDFLQFCTRVPEVTNEFRIIYIQLMEIDMPHHFLEVIVKWNNDIHRCTFDTILSPALRWEIDDIGCSSYM